MPRAILSLKFKGSFILLRSRAERSNDRSQ